MSIPLAKIPSLDLIRGFVAVGRRMSITLAAQDLFLTQSAVSRQIHGLEESLGVKLFVRSHRAIAFTAEGERLFRVADNSMQQLQDVVGAMQDNLRQRPVTVTASVGFVGLWLLPRLGRFQQKNPEIEIRLSANNQIVDLRKEGGISRSGIVQNRLLPKAHGACLAKLFHRSLIPPWVSSDSTIRRLLPIPCCSNSMVIFVHGGHGKRGWKCWAGQASSRKESCVSISTIK